MCVHMCMHVCSICVYMCMCACTYTHILDMYILTKHREYMSNLKSRKNLFN